MRWRRRSTRSTRPRGGNTLKARSATRRCRSSSNPEGPVRRIDPGGDPAPIVTEQVNHPVVMTPWELDGALDALLAELDPAAAERLERGLRDTRRDWRNAWSRFGAEPEGWT